MTKDTKTHGNVGNNYAAKDSPADSQIQMRVTREEKASYVKRAQADGLKLSAWIKEKLKQP